MNIEGVGEAGVIEAFELMPVPPVAVAVAAVIAVDRKASTLEATAYPPTCAQSRGLR